MNVDISFLRNCFLCLLQGNDLLLGNVGDSRAILGTVGEDGSLMAIQLTVDLKPDIPSMYRKGFSLSLAHYLFLPFESCCLVLSSRTHTHTHMCMFCLIILYSLRL